MGEEFKKFKKKFLTEAIVKSVITGVAAGLFVCGVLLLALKLSETDFNAGWYALIGLGVAALVGGATFGALFPTDKKIARKTDNEYGLNEKVQTMVAFSEADGEMVKLQRQDAEEKLNGLPKRKPTFKKWWQFAAAAVLALAIFIPGVALPSVTPPVDGEPVDKAFTLSQRQIEALQQLVKDTENSSLSKDNKEAVALLINTLSDSLGEIKTESVMKSAVFSTVALVDLQLFTPNSFDNIAYVLNKDEKTELIGSAITDGVGFYKVSAARFTKYEQVEEAERGLTGSIRARVAENVDALREQYRLTLADGAVEYVKEVNGIITAAMVTAKIDSDDEIRLALEKFVDAIAAAVEDVDGINDETFQNERISKAFEPVTDGVTESLKVQSYNCIMDEYIRLRLVAIFELDSNDLPKLDSGIRDENGLEPDDTGKDDDDDKTNEGGYGTGDKIYGGNDNLYHVDTGTVSPYGDKLDEYYDIIIKRIQSGEIDAGTAQIIENYFQILFGGVKRPEEQN